MAVNPFYKIFTIDFCSVVTGNFASEGFSSVSSVVTDNVIIEGLFSVLNAEFRIERRLNQVDECRL
jgi:hypothetical protein